MAARSWLDEYMHDTREMESPARFHFWTATTIAAHALGRRVWLNRKGKWATYPASMMTMLIGPSGVRKTTAIVYGTKLLKEARLVLGTDEATRINVMAGRMSAESLFDDIIPTNAEGIRLDAEQVDCVGFLSAGEMASTFGNASYMEGLSTYLMDLHDAPVGVYEPKTRTFTDYFLELQFKKDGPERRRVRNPCIGMLAGTTPTDLADTLPLQVRTNGFLARVIPVWETESGRPHNAMVGDPDDPDVASGLVEGLAALASLSGEAYLRKDALTYQATWWLSVAPKYEREPNPVMQAFYHRMQDHVHRAAIVFAAVDAVAHGRTGHRDIPIEEAHYRRAIPLVTACAEKMPECYAALQAKSQARGIREYIIHRLEDRLKYNKKTKGWYSWHALQKIAWNYSEGVWRSGNLRDEMRALVEVGLIEVEKSGTSRSLDKVRLRRRQPGPWTGKPATVDRSFVQDVNRQLAEEYDGDDEWATEYAEMAEEQRRRDRGDDDNHDN